MINSDKEGEAELGKGYGMGEGDAQRRLHKTGNTGIKTFIFARI